MHRPALLIYIYVHKKYIICAANSQILYSFPFCTLSLFSFPFFFLSAWSADDYSQCEYEKSARGRETATRRFSVRCMYDESAGMRRDVCGTYASGHVCMWVLPFIFFFFLQSYTHDSCIFFSLSFKFLFFLSSTPCVISFFFFSLSFFQ